MTLERKARTRLASAGLLFLVLASGFVLGMATDRRLRAEPAEVSPATDAEDVRAQGEEGEEREESSNRRRSLIVEQVGLSEIQKARVDSIVGHFRTQMRDLHEEFDEAYASRYREILQETREEIKGVLTNTQAAQYDSLLVEADRRRAERRRDSASGSGSSSRRNNR